jgi:hypothetical protein
MMTKNKYLSSKNFVYLGTGLLLSALIFFGWSLRILAHANRINMQAIPQNTASVGTKISGGSVEATIVSYNEKDSAGPFKSPEGKTYAVVTLHLTNITDRVVHVYPVSDTYMKVADGTVFYETPFALDSPFRSGDLLPGEQIAGELSYQVPKDAKADLFIDSAWSGGVLKLGVTK